MSKTKLTLEIEKALESYLIHGGYTFHLPEVEISYIAKEEYFRKYEKDEKGKKKYLYKNKGIVDALRVENIYKSITTVDTRLLFTAFEIKISLSDFKSKNGHNFIGNKNYYIVPLELYNSIKDLVPENIGIIVYNNGKLRKRKECTYFNQYWINREKLLWRMITRQSIQIKKGRI